MVNNIGIPQGTIETLSGMLSDTFFRQLESLVEKVTKSAIHKLEDRIQTLEHKAIDFGQENAELCQRVTELELQLVFLLKVIACVRC